MIYADYSYGTDHKKRRAYKNIDNARKSAIAWCKAHKGEFVSFYKSKDSYRPFGSMVWFKEERTPGYFKLWNVDDRFEGKGVSEGMFEILPNGKIKKLKK